MANHGTFNSVNPATGKLLQTYGALDERALAAAVDGAHATFLLWKQTGFEERSQALRNVASELRGRKTALGELMALEMGKPLGQGIAEAEKCAWVCDYYADNGADFLAPQEVPTDASCSMIAYRPLGVVLGVMPWNYPFWQVFRFAAPTLMAGNTVLLKHSSNVSGCALEIERLFAASGMPAGAFQTLLATSSQVEQILRHDALKAVSLTGSNAAGRSVAKIAGDEVKKSVLELGGSDAYVILEDADIEAAAQICVTSRLLNSGQSCIAAKRCITPRSIEDQFVSALRAAMRSKRMGDPLDDPDIGPQARRDLRDELHRQVQQSIEQGARVGLGCEIPDGPGFFYPGSILLNVRPGMPAYTEETFGPVASVIAADDEAEALRIANDTRFGLGAAIFTRDTERGRRLATEVMEAGNCFVNGLVRSDPRLPFGGIDDSGYGRELGERGIREFVNVKTVYVT